MLSVENKSFLAVPSQLAEVDPGSLRTSGVQPVPALPVVAAASRGDRNDIKSMPTTDSTECLQSQHLGGRDRMIRKEFKVIFKTQQVQGQTVLYESLPKYTRKKNPLRITVQP